eukprot:scaffold74911_cov35-Tisochrysis_lutea.AAC.2
MHASYILLRGGHVPILPDGAVPPDARFVDVKLEDDTADARGDKPAPGELTKLQELALLLAALCHDLDHPGVSNAFLVNTGELVALWHASADVPLSPEAVDPIHWRCVLSASASPCVLRLTSRHSIQ